MIWNWKSNQDEDERRNEDIWAKSEMYFFQADGKLLQKLLCKPNLKSGRAFRASSKMISTEFWIEICHSHKILHLLVWETVLETFKMCREFNPRAYVTDYALGMPERTRSLFFKCFSIIFRSCCVSL